MKIKEILTQVEVRVALAQGLDVQIHAEERLIAIIKHKYISVFDQLWWDEYLTLEQFVLDGTTGLITTSVANKIRRFIDIHSVFLNDDRYALPIINRTTNPTTISRTCLAPHAIDPSKMFRVLPKNTTGNVNVWYRTPLPDLAWYDGEYETEVNMDSELLILGSSYEFLVDDGTNPDAAQKFKGLFDARFSQLSKLEHQHVLSKHDQSSSAVPNEWYERG